MSPGRIALGGLVAAVAVMAVGPYRELAELSAELGGTLDEAPRDSAAAVLSYLTDLGPRGRELYAAHFLWDLGFVLANAALLHGLIGWGLARSERRNGWTRMARALPWLMAACDLLENLAVAWMLRAWPEPVTSGVAKAAAGATGAKLAFGGAALAAAVVAVALARPDVGRPLSRTSRAPHRAFTIVADSSSGAPHDRRRGP